MTRDLTAQFQRLTGHLPDGVWSAPGRVTLIGEHTDYNDGFVLPLALPMRTAVAVRARADERLVMATLLDPEQVVDLRLPELVPLTHPRGWAAYVAGAVWSVQQLGVAVPGLDVLVSGGVPIGAGLASSAALECAVALAVSELADSPLDGLELARVAQRGEAEFVGVPCGLMDQAAASCAHEGHALFFDARELRCEPMALDLQAAQLALLIIDTGVRHALADGQYAQLRRDCEQAARRLGVPALRDVPPEGLGEALARLSADPPLAARVRHVVSENARVLAAARLLREGRLRELGPLLADSHRSLRDDYAVSCPELDAAVAAATAAGALGARMSGGGFGGAALALVPAERQDQVSAAVRQRADSCGYPSPRVSSVAWPGGGACREG